MSESKSVNLNFGGFTSFLTIAFIVLKLMGKITWSWWWVLAPTWIGVGIGLIALILLAIIAIIVAAWK